MLNTRARDKCVKSVGSFNRAPAVADSLSAMGCRSKVDREHKQLFNSIQKFSDKGKTHSTKCVYVWMSILPEAEWEQIIQCIFLFLCVRDCNASVTPFFVAVIDKSKETGQCKRHVEAMYLYNPSFCTEGELDWSDLNPYLFQIGSVFKTLGSPTTISRACALVNATLNL